MTIWKLYVLLLTECSKYRNIKNLTSKCSSGSWFDSVEELSDGWKFELAPFKRSLCECRINDPCFPARRYANHKTENFSPQIVQSVIHDALQCCPYSTTQNAKRVTRYSEPVVKPKLRRLVAKGLPNRSVQNSFARKPWSKYADYSAIPSASEKNKFSIFSNLTMRTERKVTL